MTELLNSIPVLVSAPVALVALILFVVVAAGSIVVTRSPDAPENFSGDRQYFD